MRYEDSAGTFQASGPVANDDADTLSAGERGPATGNLITGEGTQYSSAGADSAAGGQITAIAGKGGEDSSFSGGKLSVAGEHGRLTVDADGNYSYLANGNVENVRDRFTYTLADNQGNSDTASLIVEIGKTPAVIKADAQQIVPGPDGVVTLPPGVELSDVHVVGRNLVVDLPDGSQLVIIDGAIFVPQLVLGGVEVPATNVAALLIGQEVQPAAGEIPPSSGGNFALPPPPLDPGIPLGDLIPPTELNYIPPEPQEVLDTINEEPEIFIQPDGQPASVAAADVVDEAGLPTRNGGEPQGSGEEAAAGTDGDPSEATAGTIIISSPDGVDSVTINDVLVTGVIGQQIDGEFGTLTITGFDGDNILYSYVLDDNTSGDDTQDDFEVVLTDDDGDTATATLTIDIIDDVPTARNDVDSVTEGGPTVADGNVLTGSGGADANTTDGVADPTGADDAELQGFNQAGTAGTLGVPFAADHGTLVLNADGSYTYMLDSQDPEVRALAEGETLTEVFNYSIIDGDGDPSTATLTITIVGTNDAPVIGNAAETVSEEGLQNGIIDDVGVPSDDTNSATESGTMSVSDPDGDPVTVTLGVPDANLTSNTVPVIWAVSNGGHTLTGSAGGNPVITITIDNDGNYNVNLLGPIDHLSDGVEDELSITIPVTVDDGAESSNATLTVTIEDDSPSIEAGEVEPQLLVDESDLTVNETQNFGDVFTALFGADGGGADSTEYELNISAGATGLADTATGEAVVLVMNNGVVEGRTAISDELVFTVSVNDDGDVTVDQLRAVAHLDDTNPDDPVSLANDDLITLTATVTDNDGDTDSATIGIGNNVVLEDDGPTANDDAGSQTGEDQPITVDVLANDEAGADDVDDANVSYVDGTLTGSGELVYNGDGTFTYTPAPGETGDIFFDYQILDGDNDPSVATVTIHLGDDSTPVVGTPENLEVDEDGFAFANDDEGQVDPTETDHGENLTDSGNVVVDFGNDVPADLNASIELVDNGALDGQLVDLDGNPVTFAPNGSGQLVGTANGVTVMIISITGAVAGPDAGEVTYTYSAQLLQPVQHADAGNNENSDLLSGVGFQVTDSDGDTDTGSFNVTVWDDVPSAEDIEANQAGEDANVGVSIVSSITEGADGVDLADVTFGDHDGAGSLSYNSATGEFTYDPAAGEEGDVSFSYTIVDGDGDQITKTITIHLGDDSAPEIGVPENLIVDEDGLGNANVDGAPLQSNPGETDSTESATDSGSVVVDFGDDVPADLNASIELVDNGALDGQLVDLDGNPVTFAPNGSGQLVGTANGVTVMIISITGAVAGPGAGEVTYTYSAQLLQPVQHADAGNNENSDLLSGVGFQVTDSDGDTDTGSFNVTVIDDVPSMDVAGPTSVTEGQTVNGTWTDVAGADQPGEVVKVVFGGAEYDIGVDINTGKGTLTVNADGTWSFTAVNNLDNDVAQSISFTLKITDADNDVATDVHTITINDGPPPTNSGPITLEVDDEALSSGTNAASNAEVDSDTITFTAGSDNLTVAFGISVAGLGGGLTWTRVNDTTIEGYDGGNLVVTLSLTGTLNIAAGANGNVTVTATLEENYDSHPGINVDDLQALGNVLVVGSDQDGESSSAQVNVGVSDDVPLVTTAAEDSELDPTTLTASGDFAFDIGADDFPGGTAEDYLTAALSGTVDGVAITVAQQPSFVSEVGGIATYEFTFTYDHDSDDGTAEIENGGTVAFDLVNGGYTVTLDEGFTSTEVIPVSDVVSRTGYNTEGSSPSQFEIVVSELDTTDPIFVQFTAIKGPSNNTFTADADGNPATGNSSFVAGDVFEGPQSWASISNTENGVAGDTIQSTDVLNIDFFNANPRNPDATPNPAADPITVEGLTLDLAKLGAGEDMVVILKLVSASDPSDTTTRAIIIPYSEIYTEGETLPEGYTGTLGNDLGLVVIESNDFNAAGEDYVISGAQMIMSTQNVSGSGIVLNGDVGDDGGSDVGNLATFASSGTSDQDVIKIVDIGLIRTTTTIQEVQLNFDVTVTDADGDKATDTFVINPDAETLAATSMLMSSMEPASDDASFSSLSFTSTNDNGKWNGASGNNFANVGNTGITSAMVAASGFAAIAMSSTHKFTESSFDGLVQDSFQQLSTRMAGGESLDEGLTSISFGSDPGGSAVDAVNLSSSSFSFGDQDFGSRGLDAMSFGDAEPAYTPSYASGEPTVASIPALAANVPTVSMVSAEMLKAASLEGDVQDAGAVEQVLADALGSDAPTIDAVLANLPGGIAELAAIANLASPDGTGVPAWDMGMQGGFAPSHDMLMKVAAVAVHHDAVQPA